MKVINDKIEAKTPISKLSPHPANPRCGDTDAIGDSVRENGFYGVVVAQVSTGYILAGNHRYHVALESGAKTLPVAWVDVDNDKAIDILLSDNRTSDKAKQDDGLLAELLQSIAEARGLEGTGYDVDDLNDLLERIGDLGPVGEGAGDGVAQLSRADELQQKWNVEVGQTYRIGEHVLRCGDSTIAGAWEGMLDGEADCLWTDPPYGVSVGELDKQQAEVRGRRKDLLEIQNDSLSEEDTFVLFNGALEQLPLKKGGSVYVAAPPGPLYIGFMSALHVRGWMRQGLVWLKSSIVMGRSDYHYKHEPIIYGWKPGAAHTWNSDRKQSTILEFDKPSNSKEHPTMKPVDLVAYCIKNSTHAGDIVIDPFCGSGTTLIACQELGRRGAGIEIDPKFCSVILERLSLLGLTPELQTGVLLQKV